MAENNFKKIAEQILAPADIKLNGRRLCDISVKNPNFYARVLTQGSLGLGESYMDGWWECEKLDEFFYRLLKNKLQDKVKINFPLIMSFVKAKFFNLQSTARAFEIGQKHYDTGNDLFEPMLGKTMAYSCGYWKKAKTLDTAQITKFDLICKKISLQKGQKILDIGCGWGGFAKYAAKKYKVRVVGNTVSKEQADFIRENCKGLPVEVRVQDYRDLANTDEKFDHIVSVGMFEHVGPKNYNTFMKVAKKCLKEDGLFLLHTIGRKRAGNDGDPWIGKYIFPNGALPSIKQIAEAAEPNFVIEDLHNFGPDYEKTLLAWQKNFEKAWPKLKAKYGEKFYRMWNYYLLSCAGAFRARSIHLWQIIFSPNGVAGGYKSIR